MSRKRSYWLRAWDQCYYAKHDGKADKLGTVDTPRELIEARFKELVALSEKPDQWTVQHVVRNYLADCKLNRSPATHKWYADFLELFAASVKTLPVAKLTLSIVNRWIETRYGKKSASTRLLFAGH
jgi:hypothetical protein